MRPATFGVILRMMLSVSMCLAANMKIFTDEMNMKNEQFPNHENEKHKPGFAYGGSSVNNHHYIPKQDFNNNMVVIESGMEVDDMIKLYMLLCSCLRQKIWLIQVYKLNKSYPEPLQLQCYGLCDLYIVKYV
ncbi:hypothetical protein E2542_SST25969 [Spatholobus suberectus]|nr:hypothetical protein E2542_SST25969 [Spatholobus suberectus]